LKPHVLLFAAALPIAAHAALPNATVIEYYRPDVDHYFITASAVEQAVLDEGLQRGWTRTGRSFMAWTDAALAPSTASPVCRFLGRPEAGLDSHFYSASPTECGDVARRFPNAWQLESSSVFYIDTPDAISGACSAASEPIYRAYDNRSDVNHRYMPSLDDRTAMLARGWVAEGFGASGVAMCAPKPLKSDADQPYLNPTSYSSLPTASLASATDAAAVTHHTAMVTGAEIPYTATTGHLVVRDPQSGQAQASMFYVAYTRQGSDAATRPVMFFFNGGPGSATIWLHLGSFAPKRLATGGPSVALPRPYAFVANDESLIDATDLVFVDAIGSGFSQAIAPFTNQSFWGVRQDAGIFSNFIQRYVAVNGRGASPKYVFGESYGSVRAAVLANLLETAGVRLAGVILQSSILDYNANCGVITMVVSCAGYLPSYTAVGAHYGRVAAPDRNALLNEVRGFAVATYEPAVAHFYEFTELPDAPVLDVLTRYTGITQAVWQMRFNLDPGNFQRRLVPGTLTGRYDARVSALVGTPLASGGDPSDALISGSFVGTIQPHLQQTLKYQHATPYVTFSNAIATWDFSHDGRELPDAVPDLATAMALNPRLVVLSLSGYHDLATPFFQTERDLARLGARSTIVVRNYDGGHMTYLDDNSRRLERDDLKAMIRRHLLSTVAP
jgi:carboxypeptidase C (cathepsin A)